MRKKIITYVLTLAMIFSVFSYPALGYAEAEATASAVTQTTATGEVTSDVTDTENNDENGSEEEITVPTVATVKNLKATALSHDKIKLTWSAVPGAAKYKVYTYNSKTGEKLLATPATNSLEVSKLTKATAYSYKVKACITEDGKEYESEFSTAVTCKTNPYLDRTIKGKAKTLNSSSIQISWSKVKDAKGYEVYIYNKTKKKYTFLKKTTANYLKDTGRAADTAYAYKVRAYTVQDGKTYYGAFSDTIKGKTEKTDRQKVAALALKKVGCQYKYGKAGPKKFDCSGFVYWVYNNAGVKTKVKVKRSSSAGMYSQMKKYMVGSSIKSLKKAKMGDIIFFKYGGRICHVGIYYKDGKMIHAANPRKDVCIEKVSKYNKCGYKVVGIASILS